MCCIGWGTPLTDPPVGKYRAQWNDDYHHAWHVLLTGEKSGYYRDYVSAPLRDIVKMLQSGFAYQGEVSVHRAAARRGQSSGHLPPTAFISFLQNHDQIGNRVFGERLDALTLPEAIEAALAVMLLSPTPPMLFMGEEWGETRPFPFFCDFQGALAQAVRDGRRREFRDAYGAGKEEHNPPDALSEQTFYSAKLDWSKKGQRHYAKRFELVRRLLKCRKEFVTPQLADLSRYSVDASDTDNVLSARWTLQDGILHCRANLAANAASAEPLPGKPIWNVPTGCDLPPWSVFWAWEE